MVSMVDILRDIVTTLGGTYSASDDTVSELLARIDAAYKAGGGGSSLPAVTSADNGDLLGVVEGAWAKVASTAPMIVTGTADGSSVTITTALADIKAAFDAGRTVYLTSMGMRFPMVFCEEESDAITIVFAVNSYDTDDHEIMAYAVVFDNSTTGTVDSNVA